MQFDMYHHYTVDEHTIYALGILHKIESGELAGRSADRQQGGARNPVAPRALCRGPAARHRQGPRRGSFRARRGDRRAAVPAPGLHRGPDRNRRLAGALSPLDVEHRVQARHRRSQDHRRLRRPGAVGGAPAAIAGADGRGHPRGGAEDLERVEGAAAARPLQPDGRIPVRRPHLRRPRARGGQCAGGTAPASGRLAGGGCRGASGARASGLLAVLPAGDPGAARPHGARRGAGPARPVGRLPHRCLGSDDGGDDLCARPGGPGRRNWPAPAP